MRTVDTLKTALAAVAFVAVLAGAGCKSQAPVAPDVPAPAAPAPAAQAPAPAGEAAAVQAITPANADQVAAELEKAIDDELAQE